MSSASTPAEKPARNALGPNPRIAGASSSERARLRMVESLRASGIKSVALLEVMATIPRHLFVDEALGARAYEDVALPIGYAQTISTPSIVAQMTEQLLNRPVIAASTTGLVGGIKPTKALEIGTGCGYQTAVLGRLFNEVYTIERIAKLLDQARNNLRDLRYYNVRFKHADGGFGYAVAAPYDAILLTCAAREVPPELLAQLAVGGRMVLPLEAGQGNQRICVIDRTAEGYQQRSGDRVRFVPLVAGTQ